MWSDYTSYDFDRFFFKTCDIMMIMIKNNVYSLYDLFEIFNFSNSNFTSTFVRIIINSRNIVWFLSFIRNVFIFVQTIQLKFRRKIKTVIDIFESDKNVVKHYIWCRIMFDKFDSEKKIERKKTVYEISISFWDYFNLNKIHEW